MDDLGLVSILDPMMPWFRRRSQATRIAEALLSSLLPNGSQYLRGHLPPPRAALLSNMRH